MFVKHQERKIENDYLAIPTSKDFISERTPWMTTIGRDQSTNAIPNIARLSEKSISLVNNTLYKLFSQGLLSKFHSKEMNRVVIVTKNFMEEISHCIQSANFSQDILVIQEDELSLIDIDEDLDMMIAFDYRHEMIFYSEVSEFTREMNIPWIQFSIADEKVIYGTTFFKREAV
ncbi:putative protein OS=Ureibacillus acetophenoni OX=614649 GN=SAMN05877842_11546 PE=4 SV=1 [Ureibacillus acetophenoni]